ncbi:hypothetical protein FJV41_16495 [Myxococcus llanfairpwllgwyngyllgogerychwyrndrobwllllantysiliogogogochensis]|uniref:Uncharacterized protein n=1 Tax=Myxococcus llanfairpwllgwyngyllgogerychwyrndrobwllllantysiliogogogochensis TaxID=2590453 RepID=A0A540X2I9_9BACT|nr:hypothetical protein [Myxococcus llanfairpwllgwyngyllgogerychwyrndrobwllllantysiliogogogochensis]TQF14904.1 hypothetical protein FJV41_16495 [Myxococcus llanfairpwllgwyngyllgogerychwyrndrobwllllantysiliogogogochensis]
MLNRLRFRHLIPGVCEARRASHPGPWRWLVGFSLALLAACGAREDLPPPGALGTQGQSVRTCPVAQVSSLSDSCMGSCHLGCGDGFCQAGAETEATCPGDCWCGDGICTAETVNTCPVDCGCPGGLTAACPSSDPSCSRALGDPFAVPILQP